jgi:hypothetical protein
MVNHPWIIKSVTGAMNPTALADTAVGFEAVTDAHALVLAKLTLAVSLAHQHPVVVG